jgi:hypothetical protein
MDATTTRGIDVAKAVAAVMLAGWAVWLGAAWWTAPRAVDVAQARSDIAAQQVTSVQRGDQWKDTGSGWAARPLLHQSATGQIASWTTPSGQTRFTMPDVANFPAGLSQPRDVVASGDGPATQALVADLQAAAQQTHVGPGWAGQVAALGGAALPLLTLGWLLLGGPTARGTKWFWFWLLWCPLGIGMVAWLVTERLRRRPYVDLPDLEWAAGPTLQRRASGWLGIGLAIAVSIGVGLATFGLRTLLGPGVIPG